MGRVQKAGLGIFSYRLELLRTDRTNTEIRPKNPLRPNPSLSCAGLLCRPPYEDVINRLPGAPQFFAQRLDVALCLH